MTSIIAAIVPMQAVGEAADRAAANNVFIDYTSRKAANTLRAQRADLARFANFLATVGVDEMDADELQSAPQHWQGVTWGIVEAFVKWQLGEGFAIGSVNRALSSIKTYAKLAAKAGVIETRDLMLIKMVSGYSQKEGKRVDERRDLTRIGWKKAEHTSLTPAQATQLKEQPDTPQGRRDTFLMCLLLDHGLRVGEVAGLMVNNFDVRRGEMVFFRPKVDKTQTHKLTSDTLRALYAYLPHAPTTGKILHGSRKGGKLGGNMSTTAITQRVAFLGLQLGIAPLSAHDCRHYWATDAARNGTDAFALRDAGGWSSIAMPARYVESAEIANRGVKLSSG